MADQQTNQQLLDYFTTHYLPRQQIVHRLPLSVSIEGFWPLLLAQRKNLAQELPLHDHLGVPYWYVPTSALLTNGDLVAAMARSQTVVDLPQYQQMVTEGVLDEAYFSSVIEGASTQRQEARAFLASGQDPKDKSQQMIYNNYQALSYVLSHLEEPITHDMLIEIGSILTKGDETAVQGYRQTGVQVVSGRQEVVYIAPEASLVLPMMEQLLSYLADDTIHPVLKACVAHAYFVTVHPFEDGNGRTARALSYMVLLRSGYDFFRQVPISGIIAKQRPSYYKALQAVQSPENGGDMTYFLEYFSSVLAQSAREVHDLVSKWQVTGAVLDELGKKGPVPQRIADGLRWLLKSESQTITTEIWRKKWQVSFETARQDLLALEGQGVLKKRVDGRRHVYEIVRNKQENESHPHLAE